jgi:hypothetical protein
MNVKLLRINTHTDLSDNSETVVLDLQLPTGEVVSCAALSEDALDKLRAARSPSAAPPSLPAGKTAYTVAWRELNLSPELWALFDLHGVPDVLSPADYQSWMDRLVLPADTAAEEPEALPATFDPWQAPPEEMDAAQL